MQDPLSQACRVENGELHLSALEPGLVRILNLWALIGVGLDPGGSRGLEFLYLHCIGVSELS